MPRQVRDHCTGCWSSAFDRSVTRKLSPVLHDGSTLMRNGIWAAAVA